MNKYHLLNTHNYTTFMKQSRGLTCHLPIMCNVLSSHHIFVKSDFVLKIPGPCIGCIFRKHNMFIENDSILISILRKQWISSLSVLPHKLVTPLSTIDTTLGLPCVGHHGVHS